MTPNYSRAPVTSITGSPAEPRWSLDRLRFPPIQNELDRYLRPSASSAAKRKALSRQPQFRCFLRDLMSKFFSCAFSCLFAAISP